MSIVELILLIVIAAVCGAIAQLVVGFSRNGFFVSVGVGLIGAMIGSWIARAARLPELIAVSFGGTTFPIVWSILGSIVFILVANVATRAVSGAPKQRIT